MKDKREMISRRLMHSLIRPADPAKKCGDRYLRLSSLRASRLVVHITRARDIPARASQEKRKIYVYCPASPFCIAKSIFLISPPRKRAVWNYDRVRIVTLYIRWASAIPRNRSKFISLSKLERYRQMELNSYDVDKIIIHW